MSGHHGFVRAFARGSLLSGLYAALLSAKTVLAEENEPLAVIELGAATEWGLNRSGSSFGPTAAVEFTPIKNWLVIEPGVETLFHHGQAEWDAGFVFKKPFDLTPSVEFESGIGPVWMHTVGSGKTTIGAEVVAEALHGASGGLQGDPGVEQLLDHLELEHVRVRVDAPRAAARRSRDRRLEQAGTGPIIELAVGDPHETAHLRPVKPTDLGPGQLSHHTSPARSTPGRHGIGAGTTPL